jgi:preprotein translocase subunit SecG
MTILFVILIVLACVVLGLIVLIQNPKGGGLAGNIAGFSTQFMGVKQTNDVLEKGTWIFATVIGVLCLLSSLFVTGGTGNSGSSINASDATLPAATQPPAGSQTFPSNSIQLPAPADSTKK